LASQTVELSAAKSFLLEVASARCEATQYSH